MTFFLQVGLVSGVKLTVCSALRIVLCGFGVKAWVHIYFNPKKIVLWCGIAFRDFGVGGAWTPLMSSTLFLCGGNTCFVDRMHDGNLI